MKVHIFNKTIAYPEPRTSQLVTLVTAEKKRCNQNCQNFKVDLATRSDWWQQTHSLVIQPVTVMKFTVNSVLVYTVSSDTTPLLKHVLLPLPLSLCVM